MIDGQTLCVHSRLSGPVPAGHGTFFDAASASYVVNSYADAKVLLADSRVQFLKAEAIPFEDAGATLRAVFERGLQLRNLWMWGRPPSDHSRLRRPLAAATRPQTISQVSEYIRARATALLSRLDRKEDADLVHQFAGPLARDTTFDLFGIPPQKRETLLRHIASLQDMLHAPTTWRHCFAFAGAGEVIESAWREKPSAQALASQTLLAAVQHGDLTHDEAVAQAILLMFGGLHSIADGLSGVIARLSEHRDIWDALRSRQISIAAVIEESLRLGPPSNVKVFRTAVEDVALNGMTIPAGSQIVFHLNRCNRDPAVFSDPDEFFPTRNDPKHIAFGVGAHACLGAHLARSVMQIGLETLAQHLAEWPPTIDVGYSLGVHKGPSVTRLTIPAKYLAQC